MRKVDYIKSIGSLYYKSEFLGFRIVFSCRGKEYIGDVSADELFKRLNKKALNRLVVSSKRIYVILTEKGFVTKAEVISNKSVRQIEDNFLLESICIELKAYSAGMQPSVRRNAVARAWG